MPILSKPLVVPQYGNFSSEPVTVTDSAGNSQTYPAYSQVFQPFTINLFGAGETSAPDLFAIDLVAASSFPQLDFPYPDYFPSPNACVAVGADLYVSISAYANFENNADCAAILKFQGYFSGNNTTETCANSASVFADVSNAYCGLAFDGAGTLYAVENSSEIWAYPLFSTTAGFVPGSVRNNISMGQNPNSEFGDLAFDAAGNLWTADHDNGSVLVFPKATLGTTNAFTIVSAEVAEYPVVNTGAGLTGKTTSIFAGPEGVGFDSAGNLWVGNNNDGSDSTPTTTYTALVQINPGLQSAIIAAAAEGGATYTLAANQALTLAQVRAGVAQPGYAIYQFPKQPGGWKAPQFGGLQIDAISAADLGAGKPQYLYVNDEIGQDVQQFDINPNSPTFLAGVASGQNFALGLVDASGQSVVSNPGNGGIALVYAGLLIGDGSADKGAEPDSSLPLDGESEPIFWESPDIGVGAEATPPSPPFTQYESIIVGSGGPPDVYVYVNVENIGCTPTTGSERLRVYWASGATVQNWQSSTSGSWTEITTAPGEAMPTIAAGDSHVFSIPWASTAIPPSKTNTHYCLLARIETSPVYPFGMTFWENTTPGEANMDYNVVQNSKIAQCNIYIGPALDTGSRRFTTLIQAANLRSVASDISVGFQLLDGEGESIDFGDSHLVVDVPTPIIDRFLERNHHAVEHLGGGAFHCKEPARGLTKVPLGPKETLPLKIEFTPPRHIDNFVLRAMQYEEAHGRKRLSGGQTFVLGHVRGFTKRRK